jgi:hypothetical protein
MCYCDKPTVNGEPGTRMTFESAPGIYQPNPPDFTANETLVYDEPGRCGGIDSHSHHYRLCETRGRYYLRVRHGGGDDAVPLSLYGNGLKEAIAALDSNARYWLFNTIYSAHREAEKRGAELEDYRWRLAAAQKRIKTRKQPGQGLVKVWIEPKPAV